VGVERVTQPSKYTARSLGVVGKLQEDEIWLRMDGTDIAQRAVDRDDVFERTIEAAVRQKMAQSARRCLTVADQ
jgi:hypothetical protein